MTKKQKEPTPWQIAKPLLEQDYLDNVITDEMPPREVDAFLCVCDLLLLMMMQLTMLMLTQQPPTPPTPPTAPSVLMLMMLGHSIDAGINAAAASINVNDIMLPNGGADDVIDAVVDASIDLFSGSAASSVNPTSDLLEDNLKVTGW